MKYELNDLGQETEQELHRDRITRVYLGEVSDLETQRRARERVNWIVEQSQGQRILDIGCSEGIVAVMLAKNDFRVDGMDIHPDAIEYAKKFAAKELSDPQLRPNFSVQDVFALEKISPDYDTVVLGEVLEHVYEPGNMLKRATLAIKIGGAMVVTTPWGYFPAPDHHQTFLLSNFLDIIPDAIDCEHLSIVDGYIRFLGRKRNDSLQTAGNDVATAKRPSLESLFRFTEHGALEAQKFLRRVLEDRVALLDTARSNSVTMKAKKDKAIARLQDQIATKDATIAWHESARAREKKLVANLRARTVRQVAQERLSSRISAYKQIAKVHGHLALLRHVTKGTARNTIALIARSKVAKKVVRYVVPHKIKRRVTGKLFNIPDHLMDVPSQRLPAQATSLSKIERSVINKLQNNDFVVICNSYPGGVRKYGGEFIKTRVDAYVQQGLRGTVLELSSLNGAAEGQVAKVGEVNVLRISYDRLDLIIEKLSKIRIQILVHSPTPKLQKSLSDRIANEKLTFWFHGFEIRDYRRLYFNYTTAEMATIRDRLDQLSFERMESSRACFANSAIRKIFVSNFLKTVAEHDAGCEAINAHIIPNFIDGTHYAMQTKTEADSRSFLLIRSFDKRNYANDIAVEAIKILSRREGFDDLHFTIRGFGKYFHDLARELACFPNMDIAERYSTPQDMAALHRDHGVFLCPSRYDTQGVTMGEAMASGMACITNRVAGIPEFIDDDCGILVPGDNPVAYADAIWRIAEHPQLLPKLSVAAGQRVRAQCGLDQTIAREIALIWRTA